MHVAAAAVSQGQRGDWDIMKKEGVAVPFFLIAGILCASAACTGGGAAMIFPAAVCFLVAVYAFEKVAGVVNRTLDLD